MTDRSPGVKLLLVGLVAVLLALPLMMVYALVSDREGQSRQAQASITAGWGGQQVVSGPVLVIPYLRNETVTEGSGKDAVTRTRHEVARDDTDRSEQRNQIEPPQRRRRASQAARERRERVLRR